MQMQLMLIQTSQIISGPALTQKKTKEQGSYQCKNAQWTKYFFQELDVLNVYLDYR